MRRLAAVLVLLVVLAAQLLRHDSTRPERARHAGASPAFPPSLLVATPTIVSTAVEVPPDPIAAMSDSAENADARDVDPQPGCALRIYGHVVERWSYAPIRRAHVFCPTGEETAASALAGERGEFELEIPFPGPCVVQARSDGYAPGASPEIMIRDGEDAEGVVIELDAGGTLDALVIGVHNGPPVAQARLSVSGDDRDLASDADGRVVAEHLAAGWHRATVSDDSGASLSQQVEIVEGGRSRAVLRLPAGGGRIFGRVRDATGAPFKRFLIEYAGGYQRSPIDAEGGYEAKPLQEGNHLISFHAWTPLARCWSRRVHVGAGETARLDVDTARGTRLHGVVRQGGRPRSSHQFRVESSDFWAYASADADGRYELEGVPPGEYRLYPGLSGPTFRVPDGVSEVTWDIDLSEEAHEPRNR